MSPSDVLKILDIAQRIRRGEHKLLSFVDYLFARLILLLIFCLRSEILDELRPISIDYPC